MRNPAYLGGSISTFNPLTELTACAETHLYTHKINVEIENGETENWNSLLKHINVLYQIL